jgi:hypothetical protein
VVDLNGLSAGVNPLRGWHEERMDMTGPQWLQRMAAAGRRSAGIFLRDVGHGLLEVSHNMLALLGLLVVAAVLFALGRADLRDAFEREALGWLQERHAVQGSDLSLASLPDDAETANLARSLATDPASLSRQQAAVASWLARRYRVAQEPVARLVQESWQTGQRAGLEPTLILAIMAIESSFNPFAQSAVGAQGLMQVMTRIHNDKYEPFGGKLAAFDPVTNLRVGVAVLKECIARAGGLEAGLRFYVGAANLEDDGGYAGKVLAEQRHLIRVAAGQQVPVTVTNPVVNATAAAPAAALQPASAPTAPAVPATEAPVREQVAMVN